MSILWLQLLLPLCFSGPILAYQLEETPQDIVFANTDLIILGNQGLTRLTQDLTLVRNRSLLDVSDDAHTLIISEDYLDLVVCFTYGECLLYDAEDFRLDGEYSAEFSNSGGGFAVSPLISGSFFIANEENERQQRLEIQQFILEYPDICCVRKSSFTVSNVNFASRQFVASFISENYAYFVSMDWYSAGSSKLTLIRLCNDGAADLTCDSFIDANSAYEATLSCGMVSEDTTVDVYLGDDSQLVITLSNATELRYCTFNIRTINSNLDGVFDQCIEGSHVIPLPWEESEHTCAGFEQVWCEKLACIN